MKTFAFVTLSAIAAAAASADTVQMHFDGVLRGNNVSIRVNNGSSHNVFAGSVLHQVDNIRTVTYCIDPEQWASTGINNFERSPIEQALSSRSYADEKAQAIAELANLAGQDLWSETGSKDLASAFQLAVWEVILDFNPGSGLASLSLSSGNFSAAGTNGSTLSGSINGIVNQLLGGLQFGNTSTHRYTAFTHPTHQDFMTQVPAPGAAVLALMGLPLLASRKR